MSVLTQLFDKSGHHLTANVIRTRSRSRVNLARISEICWGMITLTLFLALGPFSAIAVVFSLGSLVRGQEGRVEPSAAR